MRFARPVIVFSDWAGIVGGMSIGAATGALATITGLIADFVAHRKADQAQTIAEYLEWLRRHDHQEVAALLESNTELADAIRVLLQRQHSELIAILKNFDSLLFMLAGKMDAMQPIAAAVNIKALLTDQAVSILHQMNERNATRFQEVQKGSMYAFRVQRGGIDEVQIAEPRFVLDDLELLLSLECLHLDYASGGDRIFIISRLGAELGR